MQPSGITVLSAIGAAAPASQAGASSVLVGDGDASPGQQFAQLLGDPGAQAQDQGGQKLLLGQLVAALSTGTLTAQEVDGAAVDMVALPDLTQPVSAPEATQLIAQIDAHLKQNTPSAEELKALAQLKEQLQRIERGGEPKPLVEMVAAAPAVQQEPKLAKPLLALFAALKRPLVKSPETQEASEQAQSASTVPVNFFRTLGGADPAAAAATAAPIAQEEIHEVTDNAGDDALADTMVVLTPLAYETSVPVMKVVASDVAAATVTTAPRTDLDAAIPPLALTPEESLPQIDLPQMGVASEAVKSKPETAVTNFQELLGTNAAADKGQGGDVAALATDKPTGPLTGLAATSQTPHHAGSAASHANAAPAWLAHAYNGLNRAPVSEQVHVAIQRAAEDGMDRITIQLDPVDLGRVEVKMQMNAEGRTQIAFVVDKPETFDSLSRDARMLERSLQEAGIKADTGSMQFNLRQQPQGQLHSDLNGQGQPNQQAQLEEEGDATSNVPVATVAALTRNYTVNIRDGVDISA